MIKKSIILSIKLLIGTIVFAGLIVSGAVNKRRYSVHPK